MQEGRLDYLVLGEFQGTVGELCEEAVWDGCHGKHGSSRGIGT